MSGRAATPISETTLFLKGVWSAVALCFLGDTAGLQRPAVSLNPSNAAPTSVGSASTL
jgi:hypothetical protein